MSKRERTPKSWFQRHQIFRAWPWLLLALLASLVVLAVAPGQLALLAWSLSKISLAAYLGYWIDRSLFPYGRPDQSELGAPASAMLRRAIIVASVILGLALAV